MVISSNSIVYSNDKYNIVSYTNEEYELNPTYIPYYAGTQLLEYYNYTKIGSVLKVTKIKFGDSILRDENTMLGKIEWENPNYKVLEGEQTVGVVFIQDDTQEKILFKINITGIDKPTISSNIDEKIIDVNKTKEVSKDGFDTIFYDEKIKNSIIMTDSNGDKVSGDFKFTSSFRSIRIGYSLVEYRFTPYDTVKYEPYYGQFVVNFTITPKITVTKDSVHINLTNVDKRYTFVVNSKKYTKNTITGLKPKTKYKIEIIQNDIPDIVLNSKPSVKSTKSVSNVLYTKTITTKTK